MMMMIMVRQKKHIHYNDREEMIMIIKMKKQSG
jgi:hypothetical protein